MARETGLPSNQEFPASVSGVTGGFVSRAAGVRKEEEEEDEYNLTPPNCNPRDCFSMGSRAHQGEFPVRREMKGAGCSQIFDLAFPQHPIYTWLPVSRSMCREKTVLRRAGVEMETLLKSELRPLVALGSSQDSHSR